MDSLLLMLAPADAAYRRRAVAGAARTAQATRLSRAEQSIHVQRLAAFRPGAGEGRHGHAGRAGERQGARPASRRRRASAKTQARELALASPPAQKWLEGKTGAQGDLCGREAHQHRRWIIPPGRPGLTVPGTPIPISMEAIMREVINTPAAPAAIGPYSQAIRVGDYVFTSGQIGLEPATGKLAEGSKRRPSRCWKPQSRARRSRAFARACRQDHHLSGRHGGLSGREHALRNGVCRGPARTVYGAGDRAAPEGERGDRS